jgi:hypothetical protein
LGVDLDDELRQLDVGGLDADPRVGLADRPVDLLALPVMGSGGPSTVRRQAPARKRL